MTLWNIIRDFFVSHFFGGTLSSGAGVNNMKIGHILYEGTNGSDSFSYNTNGWRIFIGENDLGSNYILFGDWLSTTFTIIVLILLAIFLILFVKWIFKLFAGLLHH